MYVGIDVGGTKTLVAVMNNDGIIVESAKFPTPPKYDHFLLELRHVLAHFKHKDFKAGAIAVPGRIDRKRELVLNLANVPTWGHDLPVLRDVERIVDCPMGIENDAKLGALSEAMLLKKQFSKVLYVTVSTGIGLGLIVDQKIDPNLGDGGGKAITMARNGKYVPWESYAGGKAIVERYGKRAEDIHDHATWQKICKDLAPGLIELIAIAEPEVIVIGGSVGTYFERYGDILLDELKKFHMQFAELPKLRGAARAEQAVVYGCYDYAKQVFPHAAAHK